MSENSSKAKWYVVHTYSGYENKVKDTIEKAIENRGMQELIQEVKVPMEEVVEQKGEVTKVVARKIYPSYVFVKMVMTDESWYVVRNTRGVTGFVGPGSKPVALTNEEIDRMNIEQQVYEVDFVVGDKVNVVEGALAGFTGVVTEIDNKNHMCKLIVSMMNSEMAVELDFKQVSKI